MWFSENLLDGCYHDQDTDGVASAEVHINDMLVITTVFANGIWCSDIFRIILI